MSRPRSTSPRRNSISSPTERSRETGRGAPALRGRLGERRPGPTAARGHDGGDRRRAQRRQVESAEPLAGHDAAIVTPCPAPRAMCCASASTSTACRCMSSTRRDCVRALDPVEEEGIRRAQAEIARADRCCSRRRCGPRGARLLGDLARLPADVPVTVVYKVGPRRDGRWPGRPAASPITALTGAGLAGLRAHLKKALGYRPAEAGVFSARRRHLDALARARPHAAEAERLLTGRAPGSWSPRSCGPRTSAR